MQIINHASSCVAMLEESDLAVEQVADQVGFHSPVVLRDHFRRVTGVSPQAYRRRFGPAEAPRPEIASRL